jgi:hypothetical protein
MSDDDQIGYGNPPKTTRFKPGASGNPKGRPRRAKNLKTDLMEELREKVVIREGEQSRKVSKQRAVVKTLVAQTLKRDPRAATTLMSVLLKVVDPDAGAAPASPPLDAQERDVLEALKTRLLNEAAATDDGRKF